MEQTELAVLVTTSVLKHLRLLLNLYTAPLAMPKHATVPLPHEATRRLAFRGLPYNCLASTSKPMPTHSAEFTAPVLRTCSANSDGLSRQVRVSIRLKPKSKADHYLKYDALVHNKQ